MTALARVRRGVRGERGQAFNEYVMIGGIITLVAALIVAKMQTPFRDAVKQVIQFVLGQALNPPYSDAGDALGSRTRGQVTVRWDGERSGGC